MQSGEAASSVPGAGGTSRVSGNELTPAGPRSGKPVSESATAYVGLGSNLGDRAANVWTAVQHLSELPGCRIARLSALYESEPVGPVPQGPFLNAAVAVEVSLAPQELLRAMKGVEDAMGRVPTVRWGPRLIDLDLLLYGHVVMSTDELTLPHPELWNRRFVLLPLLQIAKGDPLRRRIEQAIERIGTTQPVDTYLPHLPLETP
jgi:2-amino-4-hydroxy-6-hydroxymethyldihydropteridine diphosphokinase